MEFTPQSFHMKATQRRQFVPKELKRIFAHQAAQERAVKDAFLSFVSAATSNKAIRDFKEAYATGSIQNIVRLLEPYHDDLVKFVRKVFIDTANFENRELVKQLGIRYVKAELDVDPSVNISFDPGDAAAASIMRQSELEFRNIVEEQVRLIRAAMTQALEEGLGSVQAANLFKDSVVLTQYQQGVVDNFERALRSNVSNALSRVLRDRRFDPSIERAIRESRALTEQQITKMVERYKKRMIALRAETIARTEGQIAVNRARHAATKQLSTKVGIAMDSIRRVWRTTLDGRERHTHRMMNRQVRGVDEAFRSPSKAKLMFPGDRSAPAKEVINCRCVVQTKFVDN